jgi:rhomboid protease GluP
MNDHLEAMLRLIGRDAPRSWHPRLHAEAQGLPLNAFDEILELLYLDGLVEKGESSAQTGPGVILTDQGRMLLTDSEALERFREGKALTPGDRGGIIRELLRRSHQPIVTWLLLAATFAVFGYGVYLASQVKQIHAFISLFLKNDPNVSVILHQNGSLDAIDLLRGQWWRLLSTCFVHIGLIHLLMNMYMLFAFGKQVEQMWGHWRYLVIYLVSGLGGSCLVETYAPEQGLAGASGALCGLVTAAGVWIFLNRRYLPRSVVQRFRAGFISTILLIVFISLLPGVSGLGHLGGAIGGALAAFLLNFQRFGPDPWRWLGLLGALALPWAGYAMIDHARATNPVWLKLEKQEYESRQLTRRTRLVMNEAIAWYQGQFQPMLRRDEDNWQGRDKTEVEKVLAGEANPLEQLTLLNADLIAARRNFRSAEILVEVDELLEYTKERIKLMDMAREFLSAKEHLTPADREALKTQEKKVTDLREKWQ